MTPDPKSSRLSFFAATTLLAMYVGAYYGSVAQFLDIRACGGQLTSVPRPHYGEMESWWGRDRARSFFTPMHVVDREIRQRVWKP